MLAVLEKYLQFWSTVPAFVWLLASFCDSYAEAHAQRWCFVPWKMTRRCQIWSLNSRETPSSLCFSWCSLYWFLFQVASLFFLFPSNLRGIQVYTKLIQEFGLVILSSLRCFPHGHHPDSPLHEGSEIFAGVTWTVEVKQTDTLSW